MIGMLIPDALRRQLFSDADLARLDALGGLRLHAGPTAPDEAAAARLLAGCSVAIGSWGTPGPSPAIVAANPGLRLWEHAAGTVKHFFGPHTAGLAIASCKGAIAETVAEQVLGTLIVALRGFPCNLAANRQGPAAKPAQLKVLACSRIGVVGASAVGRRVIARLRAAGAEVAVCDPFLAQDGAAALGAALLPLHELCAACDAVTVHVPLLPATRRMLRREHFAAMPDGAVLVNTARGECLDEAALIAELERGRITACLDVTSPEPAAADSPLRRLANVWLTSHLAGPACRLIGRQAADDVAAFLAGGHPADLITPDMLERIA